MLFLGIRTPVPWIESAQPRHTACYRHNVLHNASFLYTEIFYIYEIFESISIASILLPRLHRSVIYCEFCKGYDSCCKNYKKGDQIDVTSWIYVEEIYELCSKYRKKWAQEDYEELGSNIETNVKGPLAASSLSNMNQNQRIRTFSVPVMHCEKMPVTDLFR